MLIRLGSRPARRGVRVHRFYIRCPRCSAEITFKTDPKNADYTCEHGAERNFEPWRDDRDAVEEEQRDRAADEELNPMKALENRTLESKREIEELDALDEIRSINARHERLARETGTALPPSLLNEEDEGAKAEEDEDEQLVRAIFHTDGGALVRRLPSDDEEDGASGSDTGSLRGPLFGNGAAAAAPVLGKRPTDALLSAAAAPAAPAASLARPAAAPAPKKAKLTASALGIVVKKKPAAA